MIQLMFDGPGNADRDMVKFIDQLSRAVSKYQERDAERKGVWRRGGVKGQVRDSYAKAERLFFEAHHHNELPSEDDLLDIINYSVFALILLREGFDKANGSENDERNNRVKMRTMNGEWPW